MSAAVVQRQTAYSQSTGGTLVFGSNVTAGNKICVVMLHSYAGTPPSLSDSQGNTYTKHVNNATTGGTSAQFFHAWTAPVGSTGACTITMTFGAGTARVTLASEVSSLDATAYETYSVHDSAGSTTITAGSVTPTVNGSYLMMLANSDGTGYTADTGFTEQFDTGGYYGGDLVQGTAGAINPQCTVSTGSPTYSHGHVVVFKAAAGGGGSNIGLTRRTGRYPLGGFLNNGFIR